MPGVGRSELPPLRGSDPEPLLRVTSAGAHTQSLIYEIKRACHARHPQGSQPRSDHSDARFIFVCPAAPEPTRTGDVPWWDVGLENRTGRVQFPLSNNRALVTRTDELISPAQPRESQHALDAASCGVGLVHRNGFARTALSSLGLVILFLAINPGEPTRNPTAVAQQQSARRETRGRGRESRRRSHQNQCSPHSIARHVFTLSRRSPTRNKQTRVRLPSKAPHRAFVV